MTQTIQVKNWAPNGTDIRTPNAFNINSLVNRQKTQPSTVFPFVKPSSRLVQQLRKQSGLNWTELADMTNVDRRTLHNWANGKEVSPDNLSHLQKLTKIMMDHGSRFAQENRKILLTEVGEVRLIDLLKEQSYDVAIKAMRALKITEVNEGGLEREIFKPTHVEKRPLVERLTADENFDHSDADLPITDGEWLPWDE